MAAVQTACNWVRLSLERLRQGLQGQQHSNTEQGCPGTFDCHVLTFVEERGCIAFFDSVLILQLHGILIRASARACPKVTLWRSGNCCHPGTVSSMKKSSWHALPPFPPDRSAPGRRRGGGQECWQLSFMSFCLDPLRFLPHRPPAPGLLELLFACPVL